MPQKFHRGENFLQAVKVKSQLPPGPGDPPGRVKNFVFQMYIYYTGWSKSKVTIFIFFITHAHFACGHWAEYFGKPKVEAICRRSLYNDLDKIL